MKQHKAFVMSTARYNAPPREIRFVVFCRSCGRERPRALTGDCLTHFAAQEIADQHNATNIVTDVMGKAV